MVHLSSTRFALIDKSIFKNMIPESKNAESLLLNFSSKHQWLPDSIHRRERAWHLHEPGKEG
jgi:hypothetical protein